MFLSINIRTLKSGQSCNVRNAINDVMSATQHLWCCMVYILNLFYTIIILQLKQDLGGYSES